MAKTPAQAYAEGAEHARNGSPYANPYVDSSLLLCQAWRHGFQEAEKAEADGEHFKAGR